MLRTFSSWFEATDTLLPARKLWNKFEKKSLEDDWEEEIPPDWLFVDDVVADEGRDEGQKFCFNSCNLEGLLEVGI